MREGANMMFASLESKEKLFEDNSESRVRACSENDFSFRVTINPSPYPSPPRGEGIMITLRLHHKSRKKNYLRTIA